MKVFEFNNVTNELTCKVYDYLSDIGKLYCTRAQLREWINKYDEVFAINDEHYQIKRLEECTTDDALLEFAEWLSRQER